MFFYLKHHFKTLRTSLLAFFILCSLNEAFADIKVGVVVPLSGPSAMQGQQAKLGAEAAVSAINAHGGFDGHAVKLLVLDDASDPKAGVLMANRLTSEGISFVIGHMNSGVSIPASEIYAESGTLQISPATTAPFYTERGLWNTFRVVGRDDQQGIVAAQYLVKNFSGKNIAIAHDHTPYGKGLADQTVIEMKKLGLVPLAYEGLQANGKDFSSFISRLKALNIDVLYCGGLEGASSLILRQLRDHNLNVRLMGGDILFNSALASAAGPAIEGTLMTFSPDPRENPAAHIIVKNFQEKNTNPESYTLYTYAAFEILKQAIDLTHTRDPKKLATFLRSGHIFKTVLGPISFDSKGDIASQTYIVYTWYKKEDGSFGYKPAL
jgi:branched-chain amino acid transport system substrate-binding protein